MYGLDTTIFRYFNVYGDRQPEEGSYATVLGIFKRQRENNQPLTIVGDGEQKRDFTHVSDIVNANILAMGKVGNGEVFNIGTGRNHSINEIAEMFGGEKTYLPKRPGEAKETLADCSKAKNFLGYEPKVRDLKI